MRHYITSIIYFGFLSILCVFSCNTNNEQEKKFVSQQNKILTNLKFINKFYNFGNVKQESLVSAEYLLVNTGKNNLIIESVKPDCACTGYSISDSVVSPGDTANIQLFLNTHDKYGKVKAYAIVTANTVDKMYKLTIKGEVYE